jgi:hypothetical protein
MKKKSVFVIITTTIVVAIIVIATLISISLLGLRFENGKLYHREDSFVFVGPGASKCGAVDSPECGTCVNKKGNFGIIDNKICYVPN